MYRRVNSGRFIGLTTFLIVVVMAIFTWVMYDMAKRVVVLADVMLEMNDSIKSMDNSMKSMTAEIGTMAVSDEGGWVLPHSGNFAMPWIKVATNKALEADTGACTVDGIICYAVVDVS